MARKRKNLKKLDYQSAEYWERLLVDEGLSTERGTSRRITYVGDSNTLDRIAGEMATGSRDSSSAKDVTYKTELPGDATE